MKLFAVTSVYVEGDGQQFVEFSSETVHAVYAETPEEAGRRYGVSALDVKEVDPTLPLDEILKKFGISVTR